MRGQRIQTQTTETFIKQNGTLGTRVWSDYAVLLTEKDGSEVKAVRIHALNKKGSGLTEEIEEQYPEWNIKGCWRLYEDDFRE